MEIQGDNLALEILKWVGIVFAAGFIGYFGRYLSMLIVARIHKKKLDDTSSVVSVEEVPASSDIRIESTRLKVEKKWDKAKAKRLKKARKK